MSIPHNIADLQRTVKQAEEFVAASYRDAMYPWCSNYVDNITFEDDVVVLNCHSEFRGEWDADFEYHIPYEHFLGDRYTLRSFFDKLKEEEALEMKKEKERKEAERKLLIEKMNAKTLEEEKMAYLRLKAKYEGTDAQQPSE